MCEIDIGILTYADDCLMYLGCVQEGNGDRIQRNPAVNDVLERLGFSCPLLVVTPVAVVVGLGLQLLELGQQNAVVKSIPVHRTNGSSPEKEAKLEWRNGKR